MATLSKGKTFGATETVTNAKLHALVDDGSVSGIVNADIAADALIDSSKINFTLSDYVTLAGDQTITGSKTFQNTQTFSTPLANTNIAAITQANKVSGTSFYGLASCISGAGALQISFGGTGATTAQTAIDALLPAQASADGLYLTSDGTNASWGAIANTVSAGDYIVEYLGFSVSASANIYTKALEMAVPYSGTYRITFNLFATSTQVNRGFAQIYRNGSAVGTERTVGNTTDFSEDISGWTKGDLLQIYIHRASTDTVIIKNAYVKCDSQIVPYSDRARITRGIGAAPDSQYGVGIVGDLYLRLDGGENTTVYSCYVNTAWKAL